MNIVNVVENNLCPRGSPGHDLEWKSARPDLAKDFYVTGGALSLDAASYVQRRADTELEAALLRGEFCYLLTTRQMGKSSLMVRTAWRLRQAGSTVVVLDLTAIGQNLTPEQWYDGLAMRIGTQLDLEDQIERFWAAHQQLSPVQRLVAVIRNVAMPVSIGSFVVFIDEIDTVRSLPFCVDEFFSAIRECYQRRAEDTQLRRLTFCLLGVAKPAELICCGDSAPFNIGRRIELEDFTPDEIAPLAQGLRHPGTDVDQAARLMSRVFYWTGGHPYLMQRLCQAIAEASRGQLPCACRPTREAQVDSLCEELFLSVRGRELDDNLVFVRQRLLGYGSHTPVLLRTYRRVRGGERVTDDPANPWIDQLRRAGVTRSVAGALRVRNRIYAKVFDEAWIKASLEKALRYGSKSVAVLPFVSMSTDPEVECLCDALTEDLITFLSELPSLRVSARTSSFSHKGKARDVRRIGEEMDVVFIVEGSVRRMGNQLRVTAQFIDAISGYHIWSKAYDCHDGNVSRLASEVGRQIAATLQVRTPRTAGAASQLTA